MVVVVVRGGGVPRTSYLADPTSPLPSHCASIVVTSTLSVKLIAIQIGVNSSKFPLQ